MGHTLVMQWTYPVQPRPPLADFVSARILEHYGLSQPVRSNVSFRTYRATLPTEPPTEGSRTLSIAVYSDPLVTRDAGGRPQAGVRDDTAYLFLEQPQARGDGPDQRVSLEEDDFVMVNAPQKEQKEASGSGTERYQTIAVRPATAVLPLLQSIASPFVVGYTKAARSAASTTAEAPRPTVLPGTIVVLSTLTFPTLFTPYPPIILSIHSLPTPSATSIYLEAELVDSAYDESTAEKVLTEFLDACVPSLEGSRKHYVQPDTEGADGIQRIKAVTHVLGTLLRQSGAI